MRKRAKNINEFVNNMLLGHLSQAQRDFYVPLYQEQLLEIKDSLIYDELKYQTIYFMGQVGTGKTTALNFLPDAEINQHFHVVPLYATDLLDMNDIDVADVLLVLCNILMEGSAKAKRKFKQQIELIEKKHKGTLEQTTIKDDGYQMKGGGGINASFANPFARFLNLFRVEANILANIRMDTNTRKVVREMFNVRPRDIFLMTNRVIESYLEDKGADKQILLVFNELDHIKNPDRITKLFIDNRYYLDHLACKKIVSVPVVLSTYPQFKGSKAVDIQYLGLKIRNKDIDNQAANAAGNQIIEENKKLLRRLALSRIEENTELITPDALDLAIEKSGGIIRQYVNLLADAGRRVRRLKGAKISVSDIEKAADSIRLELEGPLIGAKKIDLLNNIRKHGDPTTQEDAVLIETFLANQIIVVKNEPTWYYLNPLIENTVEVYAQNLDKDED